MSEKAIAYNPVGWFEIYVDDLQRAVQFYETVFKYSMAALPNASDENLEMIAFPMEANVPNAAGALVKMEGMKAGGNSVIVYFTSEDCSVEEGRVVNAGGKIMKSKMSIGQYGFISLCFDTEGNIFGIHSRN